MRYQLLTLVLGAVLLSSVVMAQPPPNEAPTVESAPTPKAADGADLPVPLDEPMASWPGPDGFNYQGNICTYNWLDITTTGTPVTLSDDSYAGPFEIGFPFPFYDSVFGQFYVSSNGFISFDPLTSSYLGNQCPLPNSYSPNNIVALMWDDLDPGSTGDLLYYESFASCPVGGGRCLVVLYDDYCLFPGGPTCAKAGTFEAILYNDGTVRIQFLDAGAQEGAGATTGIEGNNAPEDHALLYSCNSRDLSDNLCLEFDLIESPRLATSIIHAPAVISAGDLVTYTLSISNTGLADATGTWMVDPIPANATFAYTVSPPSLIYNRLEDQVEWLGRVPRQTQADLTFAVTVTGACEDVITNTATITDPAIATTLTLQHVASMWDLIHYSETFERDGGGYAAGGSRSSWEWGSPRSGPGSAHSGTGAWATNLSGTYNDYEDSHITSPLIDLRSAPRVPGRSVWLQWWHWFSSESCCDYGLVEVRGGVADWTPVAGEFRGDLGGWSLHRVDISEFAGATDFQIRFHLHSDSSVRYPGWYVDDVAICQCSPPPGLYLGPDTMAFGCVGLEQSHTFSLSNWTGADGTFDLTYTLAEPTLGTLTGPASLFLANRTSANFDLTLTPEECLPDNLELFATVGASGGGYTARSSLIKTLTTSFLPQWLPAGNTPLATRFHAVAHHDGYLYRIGGETDWWTPTSTVQRYHAATNTWSNAALMPTARFGMDAATLGGRIYLPGGSDDTDDTGDGGTFLSQLLVYDPVADAWSTAQPLPVALAYASAVALDGKLYVIGGENDAGTYVNTLYIYDPASDSWSTGASMSESRAYAAAAAVAGKIYVAGGFAGGSTLLNGMEIYDPASDTWSPGPALPVPWAPFGQGVLSDRYFVVYNGGSVTYSSSGTSYACSQDAYVYDTHARQWVALPDLPRCLYGSQGAAVDDRFYLVSGRTNAGGWRMSPQVDYLQACPVCRDLGWLDGYVYDYDAISVTCTDASVHLEPGGANLSLAASGYYTQGLPPFDYFVTASAGGYPEPEGPYTVTVSAGATTRQNFALARPDITVDPLALSATAATASTATQVLTITNSGPYTLQFRILEAVPDSAGAIVAPLAPSQREPKSQPLTRESEIDVEPQLLRELDADESTGYLIYFRERPDLSAAFEMDWIDRGRFVVNALQEAANRSQERVRAYLDEQGVDYNAYWIDNVILVQSSARAVFDHLLDFPEIEALLSRRHPILYEPVEQAAASRSSTAVEPNLSHVGADRVWSELGITGEGIVVANIDTGVRYTHEALVNRYRGNLGAGSFDHNRNWWDPPLGGSDPVPNDWHGHGSHTMGTILGDDGGANQIGMAPGATWIACQAFEMSDDELLECGQFMAAPWDLAGANPDADLRPHVINNSWGDCLQYADHWYDGVIDSWHALGIYPVFSNGNASNCGYPSPPGCNTVGNPGRTGNVTGVGSTGRDNGLYAPHSNWGPTDDLDTVNPGEYPSLKPQVLAPGVSIRSAYNAGDTAYATAGGTSMSSPHVAGLIALMWSAAPCLVGDYAATESILQETAVPIPYPSNCGGEGPADLPNMATGWGEIDAYAAVDAAMAFCRADWLPWVKTDILSGTLGASQEQPIQVTFTCTLTATQQPQPMEGILHVLHSDPCRDPVDVELDFYCSGRNPDPLWEKRLWINGVQAEFVEGPHTVQPGDTVIVVDWVGASFAGPVTSTLTEVWDDSLALLSYDSGGVGTVTGGDHALAWNLLGIAPNTLYPITKTFEVQYGDWTSGTMRETYNVQDAVEQLPDVIIALERSESALALDKRGPTTAHDGEIVMLTLTVLNHDGPWTQVELTDPLPPGMTYAGNLTYTHGVAWVESNTIHWISSTGPPPPPLETRLSMNVGVLSPDGDSLQDLVDLLDGKDRIAAQRITGDLSTLHIDDLTPYQVIVATNNNKWSDAGGNPNIGHILADYVDTGGRIILADFSWDDPANGWQLEGRLADEGYTPYRPSGSDLGSASLGDYDPAHPVMQGVASLSAIGTTAHQVLALEAGASWIADWDDGQPCVFAQGDHVLGYNFLLDWNGIGWPWSGDVPILLENSLWWLTAHTTPLPPKVTITFDVQVAGEPGQVLRNTARMNWALGWTGDVHDILVSDVPDIYLPVIHRGY